MGVLVSLKHLIGPNRTDFYPLETQQLVRDWQRDIVRPPGFRADLKHQFNIAELVLNTGGQGFSGIRKDFG